MRFTPNLRHGYLIAFLVTFGAFLITLVVPSWSDRTAFTLYMGAAVVSAWFGGLKAGLLGTVLSAVLLVLRDQLIPAGGPSRSLFDFVPSVAAFVLVGLLASYLSYECLRAVRSAARFNDTLGSLRDAVLLTDDQGRVIYLNGAAQALTGWTAGEAVHQPIDSLVRLVDDASRRPIKDSLTRIVNRWHGSAEVKSALLLARDGTEKVVEYWAEPVKEAGSTTALGMLVVRDVTELRRKEKELVQRVGQFRALAECTPASVLLLDRAGSCVYSNPASQTAGGFTLEESLGNGWERAVHPEDKTVGPEWRACARQGQPYSREFRFRDGQGSVRWVRLRAEAARSEDDDWLGHVGFLEDLGRVKQLEHDLAELRRNHQEREAQQQDRITALERAQSQLQEQVTERRRAEEELRRQLAQSQADGKRVEDRLRQEIAELTQTGQRAQEQLADSRRAQEKLSQEKAELSQASQLAQQQLAERRRAEEELRREYAQGQAEWRRLEDQLRRELAESAGNGKVAQEQLAERRRAEEELRRQYVQSQAEAKQREEQLSRQLAELTQAGQRTQEQLAEKQRAEEQLHRDLAEVSESQRRTAEELAGIREREAHLQQQVQQLQAEQQRSIEELGRQAEDERSRWRQEQAVLTEQLGSARSLIASLGDAVCVLDRNGVLTLVNPAAEKLLGRSATDLVGRGVYELVDGTGAGVAAFTAPDHGLLRALAVQSVLRTEGVRFRRADGSPIPVACTVSAMGEAAVLVLREVAESPSPGAEPTPEVKGWKVSVGSTDALWERAANRFRPLFGRVRETTLTLKEALDKGEAPGESADVLADQVQRLSTLVDGLWAVHRIARDELPLRKQPMELDAVINRVVEAAYPFLRARGHHLTVALPLEPERLTADPDRLEQALTVLLDNATRYTEPGGQIHLTAERKRERLVLRVKDNGKGIPAEELAGLGELSARARQFWDGNGGGLGIGLALVRSLVELHGGTLHVSSSGPGKGSEFVILLPASPEGAPAGACQLSPVTQGGDARTAIIAQPTSE